MKLSMTTWKIIATFAVILAAIILIFGLAKYSSQDCPIAKKTAAAQRHEFMSFMKKVQRKYFEVNPHKTAYDPYSDTDDIRKHFLPYDCRPESIKQRTDTAKSLLDEITAMKFSSDDVLEQRQAKALAQVKHYLRSNFGKPYDEDYYAGDWMLGPNLFCWQPVCSIAYDLNAHFGTDKYSFRPQNASDIEFVLNSIKKFETSLNQYVDNMKLGVRVGMVRSTVECQAGIDAIKQKFTEVARNGKQGIFKEWYVKNIRSPGFLADLANETVDAWYADHGMPVNASIDDALLNHLGAPIDAFIGYLSTEHKSHCTPPEASSGLATLPLDYIWQDGVENRSLPTTKILPTGESVSGKEAYKRILPYFTTNDMSPEEINDLGQRQLDVLYPQAVAVAKEITGKSDEAEATEEFKKYLKQPSMFFNSTPIPANESGSDAHKLCTDMASAALYCPVRHASMVTWFDYVRSILSHIEPKTIDLFHFTKDMSTTPNCPVKMVANFNPSSGSQSYSGSARCSRACYYKLPFFLTPPGPLYNAYSVAGHEGRPGHHTQIQGFNEHFSTSAKNDVIDWLKQETYYTAFTEGWALYSENPLLAQETDLYANEPLQRYGMLKWQIWRALRLIMDTGLHYRGMKRQEAIDMFEKYAWDTTEKSIKDVTRYQSDPGQATAYMIGQLNIWRIRNETERTLSEAGLEFDKKDFHYYVLSQGSSPLSYLESFMRKYTRCKADASGAGCTDILKVETVSLNSVRLQQKKPTDHERRSMKYD